MAAADLEACVAHVEQRLLALGQALGEPDAGRLVHGLGHVGDQLADFVVDLRHRCGDRVQAGIGVAENG